MKTVAKMLVGAVLGGGLIFNAVSQVNVNANDINFRSYSDAKHTTHHYGDIMVEGGGGVDRYNWGWLWCNRLVVSPNDVWASEIRSGLDVLGELNARLDLNVYRDLYVYYNKHFIHPHPTDDAKVIKYVSTESGEALTLARGSAKTVNGEAIIKLPEHFSLVTSNKAPITVIVTPKGAPVLLYTKKESKNEIVVAMKKSDFTEFRDVEFAYQATGVRDGFESEEVIVNVDKLNAPDTEEELAKNDVKKRIRALALKMEQRSEKKEAEVKEKKEAEMKEEKK